MPNKSKHARKKPVALPRKQIAAMSSQTQSIIMPDVHDNKEVLACIKKAMSQIGGLRAFFRCPYVDLKLKI